MRNNAKVINKKGMEMETFVRIGLGILLALTLIYSIIRLSNGWGASGS